MMQAASGILSRHGRRGRGAVCTDRIHTRQPLLWLRYIITPLSQPELTPLAALEAHAHDFATLQAQLRMMGCI